MLQSCVPPVWCRHQTAALLQSIESRPDRDAIHARARYYCQLEPAPTPPPQDPLSIPIHQLHFPWKGQVYYFDAREVLRFFNPHLRIRFLPGDRTEIPSSPALLKSRPIAVAHENATAVLLKLNKIRHFIFIKDPIPFAQKSPTLIFRGKVHQGQPHRIRCFERYFGTPGIDLGDTSRHPINARWSTPKLPIEDQLQHQFILSLEGNDVASNLKWIFSSNSIAVMPKPRFETWFQEGLLIPGVHYIEIAPDYSDLQEKLTFYQNHPELCEQINQAEHQWVQQFQNPTRERLVGLLTLQRYFQATQ